MLKRFRAINNVGKFVNFTDLLDLEFGQLNIVYAENGRGKTTLSHILRSLRTGDINHIAERVTIGTTETPMVEIELDSRVASFTNGYWNTQFPHIEIFDTTFVNENVCSGYYVDVDHKRELFSFVIGEENVQLANQIVEINNKIDLLTKEKQDWQCEIQKHIMGKMSVEEFIELLPVENIDTEIAEKKKEIAALESNEQIAQHPFLKKATLPVFPSVELNALLKKQLIDISEVAANRVREHIERCLGTEGESWLRDGLSFVKDDLCPFCGQPIGLSDLVQTYEAYFSEAYNSLKNEIADFIQQVNDRYPETASRNVIEVIHNNETLAEFWSKYLQTAFPKADAASIETSWDQLVEATKECSKHKLDRPLEVPSNIKLEEATNIYAIVVEDLDTYNETVNAVNEKIDLLKAEAATGDLQTAKQALEKLENVKSRFDLEVIPYCDEYKRVINEKTEFTDKKEKLNKQLKKNTTEVLEKYEMTLNKYLETFLAGFRIQQDKKPGWRGGKASANYEIEINGISIPLGDAKTPGKPAFKSLLSEGDKSTLAFAFFMTRLDMMDEAELKKKIVVFDDPVSSLDSHRRKRTQEQIERIRSKAKQVIVLSHDADFLNSIRDNTQTDKINSFQIIRGKDNNSELVLCDIEKLRQDPYYQNYHTLSNYVESGVPANSSLLHVARCIRPLLEGHYKRRFPNDVPQDKSLGKGLIENIKNAKPGEPLHYAQSELPELTAINDFAKKFHHDENPGYATENPTDDEVKDYAKRTLELIYGKV